MMSTHNEQKSNGYCDFTTASLVYFHHGSVCQWKEEGIRQFPLDYTLVAAIESDDLSVITAFLCGESVDVPWAIKLDYLSFDRAFQIGDVVVKSDNSTWLKAFDDNWLPIHHLQRLDFPVEKALVK